MNHGENWSVFPHLCLAMALSLSGCAWSLSDIPLFNSHPSSQKKFDVAVAQHHKFVLVTPEPAKNDETEEDPEQRQADVSVPPVVSAAEWQIPDGETVESGAGTVDASEKNIVADSEGGMTGSEAMQPDTSNHSTEESATKEELKPQQLTQNSFQSNETSDGGKPEPVTKRERVIRVHLASLSTQAGANREWRELQSNHAELLHGLLHHIKEVNLRGKGTYFRLYAGEFLQLTRAGAFCDAMKVRKQYCKSVALRDYGIAAPFLSPQPSVKP